MVEDQDTILEFIQELQNEFHCMNDSRDFQDEWTFPRDQLMSVFSHVIQILEECSAVRQVLGTRLVYRERFYKSNDVFFSILPAGVESMDF